MNNRQRIRNESSGLIADDNVTEQNEDASDAGIETRCSQYLLGIHDSIAAEGGTQSLIDRTILATHKLLPVEQVHIVMINGENSRALKNGDFETENDPSRGVAAFVVDTGKLICINSPENDFRFNSKIDQRLGFNTSNLMCAPVIIGKDVVGVIIVINKLSHETEDCVPRGYRRNAGFGPVFKDFTYVDENVLRTISSHFGVALNKSNYYEHTTREKRRLSALLPIIRTRSSDEPLGNILKIAIDAVCQLLSTQIVSIYLVDQVRREAVICASKDGLEGFTMPFGKGVAGTVAMKGEAIRISNAYDDPRFSPDVDLYTGKVTKTMLCVPVPGFKEKACPVAVIQVMNKYSGLNFDQFDEDGLVELCGELSLVLKRKAIELQELKHTSVRKSEPGLALEASLLNEYGANRYKSPAMLKSIAKSDSFRINRKMHGTAVIHALSLDDHEDRLTDLEASQYVTNHDTDPFLLNDVELLHLARHMIDSYGLIERFEIDMNLLAATLLSVRNNYHPENAFHNFKHAWGTMHLCYQILRNGADEYLTSLEILAVLIAAICHDLDHPGHNNAFEVAVGSDLAMLYNDDTVLERHHCSMAFRILNTKDSNPLSKLNPADKLAFRRLVTAAIMATDMSQHFALVELISSHSALNEPFNKNDPEQRMTLVRLILHCADIGAQTQCRSLSLKWTERCLAEFHAQALKEKELGLEPTPFMQGLDDELKRVQLQQGFIGGIVVPLWTAFASCFPGLDYAVVQAIENKNYYAERATALIALRGHNSSEQPQSQPQQLQPPSGSEPQ